MEEMTFAIKLKIVIRAKKLEGGTKNGAGKIQRHF